MAPRVLIAVALMAPLGRAESVAANPIRKVVTMLQNMQAKVMEEGKREEDLFDKYMCYCKTSGGDLAESISTGSAKIESVSAELKASTETKAQLEADLKEHTVNRDDAKDTMAKAVAIREKEAAAYAMEKSELDTNIAAIEKAVAALEKGVTGGFLQTTAASVVRNYAMEKADIPDESRQELLAFLSGTQGTGYVPQSGEIIGILKTIHDEMSKSLSDATAAEESAIKNHEELLAAKQKEVASLQAQIEDKMTRVGNLGVRLAEMANDVEDTKEALDEDTKFKQELEAGCSTKEAEWEEVKKTRAEELLALAETIKVLNDDDSLELFKGTLPGASSSFVQLSASVTAQRAKALNIIRAAVAKSGRVSPGLDLIELALNGKTSGFEKVIKMIDDMVANLKVEQSDDDSKKEYCETQLDQTDDKKKGLEQSIKDSETAIDELTGLIETHTADIKALEAGIKALDKSVAEATEQRQQQNVEFRELMSSDSTAKEVLAWAKNRLNKFYNPKLYKAPPKRDLTEDERITMNMGGTLAPETLGGIAGTGIGAFVQIRSHRQARKDAPAPPPETFGPYQRKSEQGNGVIAMIDLLIKDLDKEMQEAQVSEKDAQADYEKMMADASSKRMADSKLMTEKTSAKADAEEQLQAAKDKKVATGKEHTATMEYIQSLHAECDWLMQYHAARKEARSSEIESLVNAKAVLNGADFSFMQTSAAGRASGFMARRTQ
mmetsp:Transcript_103485/g.298031  ORF Transcript_103485/g.298031 Transcript_103485/m.298031 type:complete len:723 (+) Transcript_103485:54-2222(+)